jgi:hypothetical protein
MKLVFIVLISFLTLTGVAQTEWGCTDPTAPNYNPLATADDGTCCYDGVWYFVNATEPVYFSFYNDQTGYLGAAQYPSDTGVCIPDVCTSVNLHGTTGTGNYTWSITNALGVEIAGGTTVGNYYDFAFITSASTISGCMDPQACNFDSNANCFDFTACDYSCLGCTDPNAPNFNSNATMDDGSCCDAAHYLTGTVGGTLNNTYAQWYLHAVDGSFTINLLSGNSVCVTDGCYYVFAYYGETTNSSTLTLTDSNGNVVYDGPAGSSFDSIFTLGNGTPGCNDPSACNYDPTAGCGSYNLCTYDCFGCTDPNAPNYNPGATIDNGSCCTETYTINGTGNFEYYISSSLTGYFTGGSFPSSTEFCVADGCFFLDLWSNDGMPFNWTLTDAAGNVVGSGSGNTYYASQSLSNNATAGCLDPGACNFDITADCSDYNMCSYECYGCTDPTAQNFDPTAIYNDNSCCYGTLYTVNMSSPGYWAAYTADGTSGFSGHFPEQNEVCFEEGCLYVYGYPDDYTLSSFTLSINLNGEVVETITVDPMLEYAEFWLSENAITGCGDYYACNYDPTVNCPDYYLCNYDCYGCTNANAPNFNPEATIDNGTCCYNDWYTISLSAPAYWSVTSLTDYSYFSGSYPDQNGFCMNGTCFQLSAWSFDGSPVDYSVYDASGNAVASGTINYYDYAVTIAFNGVSTGCADPYACNYDSSADCMDYLNCDYSCLGCTDPNAPNFNPDATSNDGSCCYNNWFTLSFSGEAYWYIASATGYYSGGIYPQQNGFCSLDSCFNLQVYSLTGTSLDLMVYDANGNVVFNGNTGDNFFNVISISAGIEIAGCTDANSCNYNEFATCDDGSCYICTGCTNPGALNYDSWAWYDDGSCIYEMTPPFMGMSMIPDAENNQFWVRLEMMDQGNGAPYVLSSNYDNQLLMLNEAGQYLAGPYPCDATIDFTLHSIEAGMMEYMNASMEGACEVAQTVVEMMPSFTLYPNPANDRVTISGWDANASVTISDISGRLVRQEQLRNNQIETAMLTDGIYVVTLTEGAKTASMRLVIQH